MRGSTVHHYFNNHYSLSKGTKLCSGCITQETASSDHLSIMASSYWPMSGRFRQVSLYSLIQKPNRLHYPARLRAVVKLNRPLNN